MQQQFGSGVAAVPLIEAVFTRYQEKYGSAAPVFEYDSAQDSRRMTCREIGCPRLAGFD